MKYRMETMHRVRRFGYSRTFFLIITKAPIENRKYTGSWSRKELILIYVAIIHASQNRRHFFHFHIGGCSLNQHAVPLALRPRCIHMHSLTLKILLWFYDNFIKHSCNLVVRSLRYVLITYYCF